MLRCQYNESEKNILGQNLKKEECKCTGDNVFDIDNEKNIQFYKGIICTVDRCLSNFIFLNWQCVTLASSYGESVLIS